MSRSGDFWDKSPSWFRKFWNCPRFTRAISIFSKKHSGNLPQIALPNMWSLVLIDPVGLSIITENALLDNYFFKSQSNKTSAISRKSPKTVTGDVRPFDLAG